MKDYIVVQNLKKKYDKELVVKGIQFHVQKGEIFGLLGPNGAGKTTTMEMMEGLRKMDDGEVFIGQASVKQDVKQIRNMIGIQLQSTSLFDLLTVEEILKLYASFYDHSLPTSRILEQLLLDEKKDDLVKGLSGGQKQRLAIGLALIHDPSVIFLDEPTTGLDPQARRTLWDIILQLKEQGKTIVLSTHYMEEAHILCDRLAIMDHGELMALDTPNKLIDDLNMNSVIQFKWEEKDFPVERIDGIEQYSFVKDEVLLYTKDVQHTLISLIRWSDTTQHQLTDLQTRKATLEDVFLQLTGRRLRE